MPTPKKPTNIMKLMGNPGKRPLNKNEPSPEEVTPDKPKNLLSKEASVEWDRIVPQLEACGLMSGLDLWALIAYCETVSDYLKAKMMVAKHGTVVKSADGLIKTSPHVIQRNQAAILMRQFIQEFGLSPASRSKVTISERKEVDPLSKYTGKKK